MCLIVFAVDAHPEFRLILAANRDERYARATAPAQRWEDQPEIIGGRDLEGGGTWLGVTDSGRFAAVTNYHEALPVPAAAASRGRLVTDYLTTREPALEYLMQLGERAPRYAGFNLIVGDATGTFWYSNRATNGPVLLPEGVYGLSNHLLDTPWAKVQKAKRGLEGILGTGKRVEPDLLLEMLNDREIPDSAVAGQTTSQFERALAAPFIVTPDYGTRTTSALLIGSRGGRLLERSYKHGSTQFSEIRIELGRV